MSRLAMGGGAVAVLPELGWRVSPRKREGIDFGETDDPLVQAIIDMDGGFTVRGDAGVQG